MKKDRGITLIALVIICIMLTILAGVGISASSGENGLLTIVKNIEEKTNQEILAKKEEIKNAQAEMKESEDMTKAPDEKVVDFEYKGAVQEWTVPVTGRYKLEVWGAQGGTTYGGKGGYSTGTISINKNTTLYVYVGQKGDNGFRTNAFGGGGTGYGSGASSTNNESQNNRGGGGGASDIRVENDSLYARAIVAGGGGGGFLWGSGAYNGSHGGGLEGVLAAEKGNPENKTVGQGTQIAGGVHGYSYAHTTANGRFGIGGDGNNGTDGTIAGGGGGWYRRPEEVTQDGEVLVGYTQKSHLIHGRQEIQQMQKTGN